MRPKRVGGRQRNRRVRRQSSTQEFLELLDLIRIGNQLIGDDDEFTRDLYGVNRNSTHRISSQSCQRRNMGSLIEVHQDADRVVGANHNRARRGTLCPNCRNAAGQRQLRSQRARRRPAGLPRRRRRNDRIRGQRDTRKNLMSPTIDHDSSFTSSQNCNQLNTNMTASESEFYFDLLILEELEKENFVMWPTEFEVVSSNVVISNHSSSNIVTSNHSSANIVTSNNSSSNVVISNHSNSNISNHSSSNVVMSNQSSLISTQEQCRSHDDANNSEDAIVNVSTEFHLSDFEGNESRLFSEMAAGLILSIEADTVDHRANESAQQNNDNSAGGDGVHNEPNFLIQFTFNDGDVFIAEEINPEPEPEPAPVRGPPANNSNDNNSPDGNQNNNGNDN